MSAYHPGHSINRINRPYQPARIHTGFHRSTEIGQMFQNYSETPKTGVKE